MGAWCPNLLSNKKEIKRQLTLGFMLVWLDIITSANYTNRSLDLSWPLTASWRSAQNI